jgi:hypothetical protein
MDGGRQKSLERFLTSRQRWPEGRLPWMVAAKKAWSDF